MNVHPNFTISWDEVEKRYIATCDTYPHLNATGYQAEDALADLIYAIEHGEG